MAGQGRAGHSRRNASVRAGETKLALSACSASCHLAHPSRAGLSSNAATGQALETWGGRGSTEPNQNLQTAEAAAAGAAFARQRSPGGRVGAGDEAAWARRSSRMRESGSVHRTRNMPGAQIQPDPSHSDGAR
ncbi:hypothetical protein PCL_09953 [Purpureocillium lilacinum]|uniref:Uncharacterized protein n=1 Tax=Purpureocillium lilacinum TaxID=33203 RepID=A0A2U3EEK1_PURLI|nr:hypothetical protein PCL_09953 [Purpureocillium lilacinum]